MSKSSVEGGGPGSGQGPRRPPEHLLSRALRLRCPACGKGPMFKRFWTALNRCSHCRFGFQREEGYWLGAMYFNYAFAGIIGFSLHFWLGDGYGWSETAQFLTILPIVAAVPFLLFPLSRALWLAMDLWFDPPRLPDYVESPDEVDQSS